MAWGSLRPSRSFRACVNVAEGCQRVEGFKLGRVAVRAGKLTLAIGGVSANCRMASSENNGGAPVAISIHAVLPVCATLVTYPASV